MLRTNLLHHDMVEAASIEEEGVGSGAKAAFKFDFVMAIIIFLLLGCGAAAYFWNTYLNDQIKQKEADVQVKKKTITSLQQTAELVKKLKADKDALEEKVGVIQTLQRKRYFWYDTIIDFNEMLPKHTWLKKFKEIPLQDIEGVNKMKLELEGESYTNEEIAQFIFNLEYAPYRFKDVYLTSTKRVSGGIGDKDSYSFKITVNVIEMKTLELTRILKGLGFQLYTPNPDEEIAPEGFIYYRHPMDERQVIVPEDANKIISRKDFKQALQGLGITEEEFVKIQKGKAEPELTS